MTVEFYLNAHTILADRWCNLVRRKSRLLIVERLNALEQSLDFIELIFKEALHASVTVLPAPSSPIIITENSSFLEDSPAINIIV